MGRLAAAQGPTRGLTGRSPHLDVSIIAAWEAPWFEPCTEPDRLAGGASWSHGCCQPSASGREDRCEWLWDRGPETT